ncbi:MAG: caspase family protein [Hyphomicrobium sp.]|nr:caspase family protein [Hyphomicrobium sp.]
MASKYENEHQPKKLALVVGNSDYENTTALPSAKEDAASMAKLLRDAGFEVVDATNVKTRADFLHTYFLPFLDKVDQDAFVVVYFSGHGFNYGGENYLVPLKYPTTVSEATIFSDFLSVTSLQERVIAREPGFVLILLDACRNIAQVLKHKDQNKQSLVAKGMAELQLGKGNIVIGFSSDPGKISLGSSQAGVLSIFTAALAKHMPKEDMDFDDVEKEVHYEVQIASDYAQKPWFSESSSATVYLKPTAKIADQEREAWRAALYSGDRNDVRRFVARYSTSRFVKSARQWLADHDVGMGTPFTRVSPIALEEAWGSDEVATPGGPAKKSIKLRRFDGPLAFERTAPTKVIAYIDRKDVVSPTKEQVTQASDSVNVGDLFERHGEAVVAQYTEGHSSASPTSDVLVTLREGTRVQVTGHSPGADGKVWVKALTPNSDEPVYLPVSQYTAIRTTDVGVPLLEAFVPPRNDGLDTLVAEPPVRAAIESLRKDGRSVSRVSIATPKAADARAADVAAARASHVRYLLGKSGVARQQISIVEGAPDLGGEKLRVRFFGN